MKPIQGLRNRIRLSNSYFEGNNIEWIQSGKEYFARLEKLIESAKHELHIQTYILASDNTGNTIVDALVNAATRGVLVFLFVDAYGSQKMSSEMIKKINDSGINFKTFGELYSRGKFHIGRRMHHKITVIDGHTSIIGGINISDNYNDVINKKPWLDFAVIMNGEISRKLLFICRKRWEGGKFYSPVEKKFSFVPAENSDQPAKSVKPSQIRIRRNDFVRNKHDITISYRQAFRHAKKSLVLVGGYFLPGGRSRRLMRKSIKRGVKISVIVAEKSDVKMLVNARRYLYAWLIRNGIDVYEYKFSNVHGKVLIADNSWTSIGSYDLNNLSTYSNIELNVDIDDTAFSSDLEKRLDYIMKNECDKVTQESLIKNSSPLKKLLMWISYRLVKTFFVLSFLLAGKREKEF